MNPIILMIIFTVTYSLRLIPTYAWGGKGHHHICEAATFLVTSDELRNFLKSRGHTMGHLCNLPDTYWKSLTGEARSLGDPTHYFDPEYLGVSIDQVTLDFKKLEKKYRGKTNQFDTSKTIASVAQEVGSVLWRMDQFLRLATEQFRMGSKSEPPKDKGDEQNPNLKFNQAVYLGYVYLGLMGHFIGDAAQPFHVTADFDGYQDGHGGIHAYYEEDIVNELPSDWTGQIVTEGLRMREVLLRDKKSKNFLTEKNPLRAFQLLTHLSYQDIQALKRIDPIKAPSQNKNEKGMNLRVPAQRESAKDCVKIFEPYIRTHMARAALFLAHMWDKAYHDSSKKSWPISKYKSYRYPFTHEFVKPDYLFD